MKWFKHFWVPIIVLGILSVPVLAQKEVGTMPSDMRWYSLKEAQELAKENDKKILIFGHADWCPYCRKMRKEVYPDSTIQATIEAHYYPVIINSESETIIEFQGKELKEGEFAAYLRLQSLPTHYFVTGDGDILGAQPGFLPPEVFKPLLRFVGTDAYGKMKFEEFIENEEAENQR
ncbi:MAG: thioredoxin fold domain-containing protein [Bacteroidota bacterium]